MQKCLTEKKKCGLQNFICKSQKLKCSAAFCPNASRTFYFASRIFQDSLSCQELQRHPHQSDALILLADALEGEA